MKKSIFLSLVICAFVIFSGCEKDNDNNADGNLSIKLRLWNNYEESTTKNLIKGSSSPIQISFVDVIAYKYEMKVTKDVIEEGMKESDIDWITIYESNELKKDGERDFQFTLPSGEYKGFALWQGNDFFWVGDYNGTEIQIPTSNGGDSNRIFNAFGIDGLYVLNDDGELTKVNNNEQIGVSFNIEEGKTTTVTIRTNFMAIDWYDNDGNGNWSDGDEAGDPIIPDDVSTMADFIVDYE